MTVPTPQLALLGDQNAQLWARLEQELREMWAMGGWMEFRPVEGKGSRKQGHRGLGLRNVPSPPAPKKF